MRKRLNESEQRCEHLEKFISETLGCECEVSENEPYKFDVEMVFKIHTISVSFDEKDNTQK